MNLSGPLTKLTQDKLRALLAPATVIAVMVAGILLIQGFSVSLSASEQLATRGIGIGTILYSLLLSRFLFPLSIRRPWLNWAIALVNGVAIALLLARSPIPATMIAVTLGILIVSITTILGGRWVAYFFLGVMAGFWLLLDTARPRTAPFAWVQFAVIPLMSIMIVETVQRLTTSIDAQVRRLETLNRVSRTIASTIEPHQMVSLVSAAIQSALPADTYFVALLRNGKLHLELFYDDGEFFPPTEIDINEGLAGWVIRHQESLFLTNLPEQLEGLGVSPKRIGQDRHSLSWMGTPLEAGGHVLGLVAVASYHTNAFSRLDLELMESIAQQAALALVNAYHHAEVEKQSRLDSLTGAYNHGHFLSLLTEYTDFARVSNSPLSLILLDIDLFKQYNDHFGHMVGDEVLVKLTATLEAHIRSTDAIGRWGGEEFAILLPNTNGEQATQIAQRVSVSLRSLSLETPDGLPIEPPTISQGIAVFPHECDDLKALIHLADQRLYLAKNRGRDQIEPYPSHWLVLYSQATRPGELP